MNLEDLITKWTEQIAMHRRVVEDPLMWTKEDRLKSSHQTQALCAIMGDIKKLDGNTVKLCEGLSGQLLHEQYRDKFKHNYCPKCGLNLSPE